MTRTSTDTAIAERMRRQARMTRVLNIPMRRLLRLPFPTPISRRLMLLTLTGRKTGRIYLQPVSYVQDDDGTLLTPGGGRWTYNLRQGQPVPIRLAGHRRTAVPELVRDRRHVEMLLDKILKGNPAAASFMPFVGAGGRLDADKLTLALDHGFCVVRWTL